MVGIESSVTIRTSNENVKEEKSASFLQFAIKGQS